MCERLRKLGLHQQFFWLSNVLVDGYDYSVLPYLRHRLLLPHVTTLGSKSVYCFLWAEACAQDSEVRKKTIDKLRAEGCHTLTLDTWRQRSQNILAFSPTNQGADLGQSSWNSSQRDRTILLDRFETTAAFQNMS